MYGFSTFFIEATRMHVKDLAAVFDGIGFNAIIGPTTPEFLITNHVGLLSPLRDSVGGIPLDNTHQGN